MSSTNLGNQTVLYGYKQTDSTSDLNKRFIFPHGIYQGGTLSIDTGNTVNIATFKIHLSLATGENVYVETGSIVQLIIDETTPYITASFTWASSSTNYLDFTAKALGSITSTDIVFGKGVYVASVLTSFAYDEATYGFFDIDTLTYRFGNSAFTGKLISLNASSTTALTTGAGIDILGDSDAIVGYVKIDASDNSLWKIKSPGNAGILTLDINATKTITVAGNLDIAGDSAIDQDLQTTASPTFVALNVSNQITSTLATGTSPFAITSTTVNTNLNADMCDGQHLSTTNSPTFAGLILNGNISPASGYGIDFSATSDATGMTSELFDDYEEGTWTPGIEFGGGTTGIVYATQLGQYTKKGREVTVTGRIALSDKGSSSGTVRITGLPYTVGNGTSYQGVPSIYPNTITFADFPTGYVIINDTDIELVEVTNAGVVTAITNSDFSNNSAINFLLTYSV